MRALAVVVILASPSLVFAKPTKITLPAGNGDLTLTFDPKKISQAELTAAATLAPESNPAGVQTSSLSSCREPGGKMAPCAKPQAPAQPNFLRDAEVTVKENVAIVRLATERKVAKELEPAKEWLRKQTAFYAGMEERKLAFYKSWKSTDLAPPIEGIDGATVCAPIVAKIDAAKTKDAKFELVSHSWHNCMNDQLHAAMGEYPSAPWKAFLKAKGVKAKFVLPEGD